MALRLLALTLLFGAAAGLQPTNTMVASDQQEEEAHEEERMQIVVNSAGNTGAADGVHHTETTGATLAQTGESVSATDKEQHVQMEIDGAGKWWVTDLLGAGKKPTAEKKASEVEMSYDMSPAQVSLDDGEGNYKDFYFLDEENREPSLQEVNAELLFLRQHILAGTKPDSEQDLTEPEKKAVSEGVTKDEKAGLFEDLDGQEEAALEEEDEDDNEDDDEDEDGDEDGEDAALLEVAEAAIDEEEDLGEDGDEEDEDDDISEGDF